MLKITWKSAPIDLKLLMVSSFLMVIGFYSLIPRLSLHLSGSLSWSMALTGVVLAMRQVSQQGLSFVGGMIVDRIGPKQGLIFGIMIRGVGFLLFAFSHD